VSLRELVRAAYPDPEVYLTAEAFARYHHDDVAALDDDALTDERLLALLRRALERPSARCWLSERIERLEQEAARRKRPARRR
jgi:hypothetical protein